MSALFWLLMGSVSICLWNAYSWHHVVYLALLKITLVYAYMHFYCCECIRIYENQYLCIYNMYTCLYIHWWFTLVNLICDAYWLYYLHYNRHAHFWLPNNNIIQYYTHNRLQLEPYCCGGNGLIWKCCIFIRKFMINQDVQHRLCFQAKSKQALFLGATSVCLGLWGMELTDS